MVDPYDWLGLPKAHRPPTHYQLLGLSVDVVDPVAIRAAADRQFRRILPHMTEEHALQAEQVWAELEEARDTLLDADRRAHYDAIAASTAAPIEQDSSPPADAPLSGADLDAASLPDPKPWWTAAVPEAPVTAGAWWKEAIPAKAIAPTVKVGAAWTEAVPPARLAPVAAAPRPAPPPRPRPTQSAELPAYVPLPAGQPPRKSILLPALIGGLLVSGVIAAGVYFAFGHKYPDKPTPAGPVADQPELDQGPRKFSAEVPPEEEPLQEVALPKDFSDQLRPRTFKGHVGGVNWLSASASGSRFASVGNDRTLRLWSVTKDEPVLRHSFLSPAIGVEWCDHDKRIVAADGITLAIFDAKKSSPPRALDSTRAGVSSIAVSIDGTRALTGLTEGSLRVWDTNAGRPDEWAVAARGPVSAVAISPDKSLVLAAIQEGGVSVWNLANRTRVHEWNPHPGGAISLSFAPDGARVATCGPDGSATVYDLTNRKEICRTEGHTGPVMGVAWLPDGRQIVTVGVDGQARLWAADTGNPLRWSQTLEGKGSAVAVDPEGRYILAGMSSGVIQLFPLPRVKSELITAPLGKPLAEPLPVPSPDAVAAAVATLQSELSRDYGFNRPDDMALLADNLRRRAAIDRVPPALRYGLLQEARTLATRAGDVSLAFLAIENLASWFDVDELAEKKAAFAAMPADVDWYPMLTLGLASAEQAETDARPELVEHFLKRLPAFAPHGTPIAKSVRLSSLRERAIAAANERKSVLNALGVLNNAPNDQASNHTYGAFLCFTRQEWSVGLPFLVRGSEPRFIDAARADLGGSADPKGQHRLGEAWYGLAIEAKDHRAKRAMLRRARLWFEHELRAKLAVIDEIKARARLDDISKLDVPAKDPNTLPLYSPLIVRRAFNTLDGDAIRREWRIDGGAELRANGVYLPGGSPGLQSRFGLAPGGRMSLTFRTDGREVRIQCAGQEFAFAGAGKGVRIVVERTDTDVKLTAIGDEGEPVVRTAAIPANMTGPTFLTMRLTGASEKPGASIVSAIVRGPASLSLPIAE